MKQSVHIKAPCCLVFETNTGGRPFVFSFINGKPYHVKDMLPGFQKIGFNVVHPGMYYSNALLNGMEIKPLDQFPKVELPEPDRDFTRPFDICYDPKVKGPACIYATPHPDYMDRTKIFVGDLFLSMPYQAQQFVLSHEKGHFKYSDEIGADLWALNDFLSKGFNPSQAVYCLEKYLSYKPENVKRIFELYNRVKNM